MKALVLKAANTPFELTTLPDPAPGPGEAVARVLACGSGLTIQHIKAGRIAAKFPRIIGHEITGEIVAVGKGVSGLRVGDGVTTYYYLNCGHCRWCRSGCRRCEGRRPRCRGQGSRSDCRSQAGRSGQEVSFPFLPPRPFPTDGVGHRSLSHVHHAGCRLGQSRP